MTVKLIVENYLPERPLYYVFCSRPLPYSIEAWQTCTLYTNILCNCACAGDCVLRLPYSGKFSYGANFRIFRVFHPFYENKNCENLNVRNFFLPFVSDL